MKNKKKLPRAIVRPSSDASWLAVAHSETDQPPRADPAPTGAHVLPPAPETAPTAEAVPVAAAPTMTRYESEAARRRSRAGEIVERHAKYSAIGGLIPLPIANLAGLTAIIVRMVKGLSDVYGVPFERDRTRAMVVALMGGATPSGLAVVTASTLVHVVPGANLVGLAVSAISAVACTRGIGRIFIEHFESTAAPADLTAIEHP